MAKEPETKKTMDIAKPGKSTPDTSARPVLVTHRPMVQDPMVKDDKDEANDSPIEPQEGLGNHGGKVIQPMSDQTEPDEPKEKEEAAAEPEAEAQPVEPEKTEEQKAQAEEAAIVDATAEQADVSKKRPEGELSPEEKAKQEALQKLITEKKYFVTVGQVSQRRNRRVLIVLIVLLLILAGGYLVIDAGLIKTTIKLPLDLIKN